MFATVAGVLVSEADAAKNQAHFDRIYRYVLPVFCGIVLALSGNVYSWITVQLMYIRHTGVSPVRLRYCPTYDEYKDLIIAEWKKLPWLRQARVIFAVAVFDFVSLPFKIGNIYCYYLALYIASGVLALTYGYGAFDWRYVPPYFAVFAIVTHSGRRARAVSKRLPKNFALTQ